MNNEHLIDFLKSKKNQEMSLDDAFKFYVQSQKFAECYASFEGFVEALKKENCRIK